MQWTMNGLPHLPLIEPPSRDLMERDDEVTRKHAVQDMQSPAGCRSGRMTFGPTRRKTSRTCQRGVSRRGPGGELVQRGHELASRHRRPVAAPPKQGVHLGVSPLPLQPLHSATTGSKERSCGDLCSIRSAWTLVGGHLRQNAGDEDVVRQRWTRSASRGRGSGPPAEARLRPRYSSRTW